MQQRNNVFKLAISSVLFAGAMAAGSATAGPGTIDFTANIKTTEFLLPAANCTSGVGGIGAGTGTTNLFTKNPATDKTTIVLTSFDCVNPSADGFSSFFFGPGKFTLTGAGGDTIFATYSGTLNLTGIDQATGLPKYEFAGDAMFNIQGGTGRYVRATGSGYLSGYELVNDAAKTAQGTIIAVGKIVY